MKLLIFFFFFFFFEIFHWAIPEKKQAGGVEDMEFLRKWDFQWLIKNNVEWWSRKNNVQFPGVLVLGLKISKGCNRILQSFQRWSFVLSAISRGKVRNLKICLKSCPHSPPSFLCRISKAQDEKHGRDIASFESM